MSSLRGYRSAVIARLLAFGVLAVALAACAPHAAASRASRPDVARRVVSLVPSLTEDLFAIGAGPAVVAVSAYTDYPAAAKRLPVVASFASIATERIVALHPDLVVGIAAQARLAADLRRAGAPLLFLRDDTYDDIFANLTLLGARTGHERAAAALVRSLRARTARLTSQVAVRAHRPRLFVVLGTTPIFTVGAGSYIERLLTLAGARNAADDVRAPYARYSAEALVARQPDALVVDPAIAIGGVLAQPPWSALRAVREHRVYTLPDAALLLRPGPRYNDGLAWLVSVVGKVPS